MTQDKKIAWAYYKTNILEYEKLRNFYNNTTFKIRKQIYDDIQAEESESEETIDLDLDIENLRLKCNL